MSPKQLAYYLKKSAVLIVIALLIVIVNTVLIYRSINRMPNEHMIFYFYETNVPGASAQQWAEELKQTYPSIKHVEAQSYTRSVSFAYSNNTTGWDIIITRLANTEGDILFIPYQQYENMLINKDSYGNRALMELDPSYFSTETLASRGVMLDGALYGIRVDGLEFNGLTFPVAEGADNVIKGRSAKEVIACIYINTVMPDMAQKVLSDIINSSKSHES